MLIFFTFVINSVPENLYLIVKYIDFRVGIFDAKSSVIPVMYISDIYAFFLSFFFLTLNGIGVEYGHV